MPAITIPKEQIMKLRMLWFIFVGLFMAFLTGNYERLGFAAETAQNFDLSAD